MHAWYSSTRMYIHAQACSVLRRELRVLQDLAQSIHRTLRVQQYHLATLNRGILTGPCDAPAARLPQALLKDVCTRICMHIGINIHIYIHIYTNIHMYIILHIRIDTHMCL